MTDKFNYIDLFSGCGGLSLGLHQAGWKGLFAIEKSGDAFKTLEHNLIKNKNHFEWVDWLDPKEHDINDVLEKHEADILKLQGKVDLVAGGPPCQGFSLAGLRNEMDLRNSLINSYIRVIELVRPKILFFENVSGFAIGFKQNAAESQEGQTTIFKEEEVTVYSQIVLAKLRKLGYSDVEGKLLDFSDYGVPQSRKRFIIIGTLAGNALDFYKLLEERKHSFLRERGLQPTTNLSEAISDLHMAHGTLPSGDSKGFKAGKYGPIASHYQSFLRGEQFKIGEEADSHRFVNHRVNIRERFRFALDNQLSPSDYRRHFDLKKSSTKLLSAGGSAPTLTTLPDDYIHYFEPRILTVREYARIQSFPDWFKFQGKYTTGGSRRIKEVPRYTQIGNAIPPLFAEQAGNVLKEILTDDSTK